MNCEAVRNLLWAYLEKETTAEEAEKIEKHLAECADCREELEAQKTIMETLAGLPDEELPEGYHEELMQKLRAEAASNVVPFPQKKKQPMWKQWGMIAAAVLVVVAAGGMDGMLAMRESQNAAVQEMKAADTAAPMEASIEDMVVEEESGDITAELQKDSSVAYSSKKMNAPAAGAKTEAVTTQGKEAADSVEISAYGVDDAAAVLEMASLEEETVPFSVTRSKKVEATERATLLAEDLTVAMAAVQKAIAEAGGFEEAAGAENSILAAIPAENYDAFVKAMEHIGTLEWTMQSVVEEGMTYRTVEVQLKTK